MKLAFEPPPKTGNAALDIWSQKIWQQFNRLEAVLFGSGKVYATDEFTDSASAGSPVKTDATGKISQDQLEQSYIDHNEITNTHNLTTDIDHNSLTHTHNLTTDIDHESIDGLLGGAVNDHYHLTGVQKTDLTDGGDTTLHYHTVGTSVIANHSITYAKIQQVSATDKILGRVSSGAGDVEEIACTSAGRALIDDANATAQRATLGLGPQAYEADAKIDYTAGDLDSEAEIITAINSTNTKINSIITKLETLNLFSSTP